jgi:5'-nucleotidase
MARIFKMATFPILCSNYDFTGTVAEGVVKPFTIIKRKGIKIGVFALNPEMDGLVSAKNYPGVKFLDPTEVANNMASMLKKEKKCDMVICISHLGWTDEKYSDKNVFSKTRGIDLVLGGHSHTYFQTLDYVKDLDGKLIPVDQNGKHGIFIGKLTLSFEKK